MAYCGKGAPRTRRAVPPSLSEQCLSSSSSSSASMGTLPLRRGRRRQDSSVGKLSSSAMPRCSCEPDDDVGPPRDRFFARLGFSVADLQAADPRRSSWRRSAARRDVIDGIVEVVVRQLEWRSGNDGVGRVFSGPPLGVLERSVSFCAFLVVSFGRRRRGELQAVTISVSNATGRVT